MTCHAEDTFCEQTYNEVLPAGNREGHFVAVETQELQEGQKFGDGTSSIMSFKEVGLTVGELDFQVSLHIRKAFEQEYSLVSVSARPCHRK